MGFVGKEEWGRNTGQPVRVSTAGAYVPRIVYIITSQVDHFVDVLM